jgi:molybdopterin-guanine dinucleotide biosynthesis protein B
METSLMPLLIGVVGYKNSGKTTLVRAMAQALAARGHRVAVIKHSSHHIDVAEKDTSVLLESAVQVAIASAEATAVFWQRPLSLEEILPSLDADIVLVEGFKHKRRYPKIACLRGRPDDGDLLDAWTIAAVSSGVQATDPGIPHFDRNDVESIVDFLGLTFPIIKGEP